MTHKNHPIIPHSNNSLPSKSFNAAHNEKKHLSNKYPHEYDDDNISSEEKEDDDSQRSNPLSQKHQTTEKKPAPVQHQVFNFLQVSAKDHGSVKKLANNSRTKEYIGSLCYVPDKNRLLILFKNRQRINGYNSIINSSYLMLKETLQENQSCHLQSSLNILSPILATSPKC